MKCLNCETESQEGDKFCLKCGTALIIHKAEHVEKSVAHPSEEEEKHIIKCHNCGAKAQKDDKFCLKCGTALKGHNVDFVEVPISLPGEQAERLIKNIKKMVGHLSNEERIMGVASVVALLSFFMPWYGGLTQTQNGFAIASYNNWYYLLPLFAITSIIFLYFGQVVNHTTKVFNTTIQAVIGMFIFATGIHTSTSGGLIGIWLTIIAGGVLTGASLYFQKKILQK
jgi:hypothetical protein